MLAFGNSPVLNKKEQEKIHFVREIPIKKLFGYFCQSNVYLGEIYRNNSSKFILVIIHRVPSMILTLQTPYFIFLSRLRIQIKKSSENNLYI